MKKRSPRTRFFWCYTLGFLLCAAVCYCWFLIKGKTLIVDSDGWRQHFAAFVYLGQYGREVARTLLTTHKLVLPQWDFSIGLGSDVLTTLHFYAIGDPLDLLSVVCPTRYAAYLYSFLSLLRLYLAGLAFGAFCFVKNQRRVGGVTVGALVYVFTLFSLFIVSHHPFFALPMVFLPLLLLGVEQILASKRPYLFIFIVFLAAVSNFYFFYMLAIITALYTLYQLICRFRHRGKAAVGKFFQITGCALLGVVLSAVVLLPVVLAFMGDSRSAESYVRTWVYSADYYRNFLSALFTAETKLGYLTFLGYNAVAFPAVCLLFFAFSTIVGGKGVIHRLADLFPGDTRKYRRQALLQLRGELLPVVDVQEGVEEVCLLQIVHVAVEQLGVVGHHGAVVVVVALLLIHIVG